MLSLEQLTEALKVQKPGRPEGWWTASELRDLTGWSHTSANKAMRTMFVEGKIQHVGTVDGVRIDGKSCKLPAYMFTREDKALPTCRKKTKAQGLEEKSA